MESSRSGGDGGNRGGDDDAENEDKNPAAGPVAAAMAAAAAENLDLRDQVVKLIHLLEEERAAGRAYEDQTQAAQSVAEAASADASALEDLLDRDSSAAWDRGSHGRQLEALSRPKSMDLSALASAFAVTTRRPNSCSVDPLPTVTSGSAGTATDNAVDAAAYTDPTRAAGRPPRAPLTIASGWQVMATASPAQAAAGGGGLSRDSDCPGPRSDCRLSPPTAALTLNSRPSSWSGTGRRLRDLGAAGVPAVEEAEEEEELEVGERTWAAAGGTCEDEEASRSASRDGGSGGGGGSGCEAVSGNSGQEAGEWAPGEGIGVAATASAAPNAASAGGNVLRAVKTWEAEQRRRAAEAVAKKGATGAASWSVGAGASNKA